MGLPTKLAGPKLGSVNPKADEKFPRENPSFAALLEQADFMAEAYGDALLDAMAETGLDASTFPSQCPYDAAEIIRAPE